MGRIMRPYDGKDYGLWLDHSGNYLRFRKEWDTLFEEGVTELQNGTESAKKEPDEKEKKEAKCPACGALWVWSGRECGECGHEKPMKQILNVPGELTELETTKREILNTIFGLPMNNRPAVCATITMAMRSNRCFNSKMNN
jgi:hypothetical protein